MFKFLRIFIALSMLCILSACGYAEHSRQYDANLRQKQLDRLQSICDGMGFRRGTDNYKLCLMQANTSVQLKEAESDRDSKEMRALCVKNKWAGC